MECRRIVLFGLMLATGVLGAPSVRAAAPGDFRQAVMDAALPWEEIAPAMRERVRLTVDKPLVTARGPVEVFSCQPATYHWLVSHPDRAVLAWHRLGADCAEVVDRGGGRYGWTDGQGSDVGWETVYSGPKLCILYATGQVRPGLLLPTVPFQAVFVLRHAEIRDSAGQPLMRHQAELFLHSDSKTASFLARLLGPSAPRLAEQYVAQVQQFFSVLATYLTLHPELTPLLLAPKGPREMLEGIGPAVSPPVMGPWTHEKR